MPQDINVLFDVTLNSLRLMLTAYTAFLNAFNELYAEYTDAEKKQFMQAFIERIDIFPERREDGN